ncbi:hypothetical protein RRG08_031212 [Elysia crispata]|uniref:Uncharacterized protein n=1 Tax=Elysia crispata TaxID=231223 RepID=A0AAE0XNC3_9GAST|nr:hypothetical protein RRG08_031212 [Elysia crispata]
MTSTQSEYTWRSMEFLPGTVLMSQSTHLPLFERHRQSVALCEPVQEPTQFGCNNGVVLYPAGFNSVNVS